MNSVGTSGKTGLVVSPGELDRLVGRLLTIIDATYTDVKQREASKTLFRSTIWDWFNGIESYTDMYDFTFTPDGKVIAEKAERPLKGSVPESN